MAVIETYTDLHHKGTSLAYHCWRYERWADVDLAAIVAAGQGDRRYVGRCPRCGECGEIEALQVRSAFNMAGSG